MSEIPLSHLNSVFQLFVALAIGVSTFLEPTSVWLKRLIHRLDIECDERNEEAGDANDHINALQIYGKLIRLERKFSKSNTWIIIASITFSTVNFILLSYASISNDYITASNAVFLLASLLLTFLGISLFNLVRFGRRLLALESEIKQL